MQNTIQEFPLFRPNGAASAYGTIIRQTESPRDIEYRVFEKVTASLEVASNPEAHFTQRIKAVHDNRTLWQTLAYDLANDDNPMPVDLRARLISLAIWVTGESDNVTQRGSSLQDLIDINHTIMQGLRPARQGAA